MYVLYIKDMFQNPYKTHLYLKIQTNWQYTDVYAPYMGVHVF